MIQNRNLVPVFSLEGIAPLRTTLKESRSGTAAPSGTSGALLILAEHLDRCPPGSSGANKRGERLRLLPAVNPLSVANPVN